MSTFVCSTSVLNNNIVQNNNSDALNNCSSIKHELPDIKGLSNADQPTVLLHADATDLDLDVKEEPELSFERSEVVNTEVQIKLEADPVEVNPDFFQDYDTELMIKEEAEDDQEEPGLNNIQENFDRQTAISSSKQVDFSLGKHLTMQEMVRLHFDPALANIDLHKQPLVSLRKVDTLMRGEKRKKTVEQTVEVKEEFDDWDIEAEKEILSANKDFTKNYVVIENMKEPTEDSQVRKHFTQDKADPRGRSESPDDPDSLDFDEDEENEIEADDLMDDDYVPSTKSRRRSSLQSTEDDNDNFLPDDENSNSEDGSPMILDEKDIKLEDVKMVDVGGMQIETFGDYSKCPKCEKHIKSTFIIRHIKLHDTPTRVFKCPHKPCPTTFTRTNNMYRHMKIVHEDPTPYICVYKNCTQAFKDSKSLREHTSTDHKKVVRRELEELDSSDLKFKCDFPGCGREYGKRQHLKEHYRKHTGDMRYSCDVCGEKFFVHGHMKRHLYSHTGIKPHACRWKCGAIFASYGGRMKHERAQHSENPYKLECDICGRPFRFDRELDKHKLTHLAPSERQAYRCSFCGIIFDSISHRERHEQRHKDNDTFQCEDCQKVFKNEKNLRHHSKTHHEAPKPRKKKEGEKEDSKKERKEPPKYPCHMCDIPIMFALTALRRHLARKHSTNFKCDKEGCDKTFAKKYQFDAHMKLHSHRHCHLCGKDFKRKQNADIHLMGVHGLTKEDLQELGR